MANKETVNKVKSLLEGHCYGPLREAAEKWLAAADEKYDIKEKADKAWDKLNDAADKFADASIKFNEKMAGVSEDVGEAYDKISEKAAPVVDKIQEKAGVETTDQGKLSSTLAYIIYVLILIPIIITALRALRIPAIAGPSISMLNKIFDYVPSIIVTILIIVIGNVIAKFAGQIVTRLIDAGGLDDKLAKLLGTTRRNFSLSRTVGTIVHVIILIFFIVQSFGVLHLEVLNNIGNSVIGYMPSVLSALIILAVCYFAANVAEKAVTKASSPTLAKIVYFGVWVIGIFMTLNQLGIARSLVETAFMAIIGAFAIAVAVAFGVGGKDFAARALDRLEKENKKQDKEKQADKKDSE